MKLFKLLLLNIIILNSFLLNPAFAGDINDNRIKTYKYDENKVFLILIHHGFQSSIEFAKGEEIETLSVGDSYAWKITPVGRRLFIKPLEEDIKTNMTIITNKRTYHFDVVSKSENESIDKDLSYVIRFNYPDNGKNYNQFN